MIRSLFKLPLSNPESNSKMASKWYSPKKGMNDSHQQKRLAKRQFFLKSGQFLAQFYVSGKEMN